MPNSFKTMFLWPRLITLCLAAVLSATLLIPSPSMAMSKKKVSTRIAKNPGGKKPENGRRTSGGNPAADAGDSEGVWIERGDSLFNLLKSGLEFTGYSKKLSSSEESVFVRNVTGRVVSGFRLKVEYLDLKGRELNSREVELSDDVKQGAWQDVQDGMRRLISFKSWDVQKQFYHYLTPPKRSTGTPYKVKFILLAIKVRS